MITGKRKPLTRIFDMLAPYESVLVVGCGTCMTVCMSGGLKEAEETAAALRLHRQQEGRPVQVKARVVERQCEPEFLETLDAELENYEVVLSLACGIGVQCFNLFRPQKQTLPGLDTWGAGYPVKQGFWQEACLSCGDCVLDQTGGICPITRCAKSMQNGPCGGSQNGKCEVNSENECAWQLIYDRLTALGKLALLDEIRPPKDWSRAHHGGPRKLEREDMQIG
ncbi:zinc-finger protein [Clostridiales bacterium PH28_bin88]|nr:zinc-finger protein [Clostridiales bacterium PH28_bin88]